MCVDLLLNVVKTRQRKRLMTSFARVRNQDEGALALPA